MVSIVGSLVSISDHLCSVWPREEWKDFLGSIDWYDSDCILTISHCQDIRRVSTTWCGCGRGRNFAIQRSLHFAMSICRTVTEWLALSHEVNLLVSFWGCFGGIVCSSSFLESWDWLVTHFYIPIDLIIRKGVCIYGRECDIWPLGELNLIIHAKCS